MSETKRAGPAKRGSGGGVPAGFRSSNQAEKARNAKIREWVNVHPSTNRQLVRLELLPNEKRGAAIMAAGREENLWQMIGTYNDGDGGRPLDVHCRYVVSGNLLPHEKKVTDVAIEWGGDWVRGKKVDRTFNADGERTVDGDMDYIEFDTGSEDEVQVLAQWAVYAKHAEQLNQADRFVIWVCETPELMRERMRIVNPAKDVMLFTSLPLVQADPFGDILRSLAGGMVKLAKPPAKPGGYSSPHGAAQ